LLPPYADAVARFAATSAAYFLTNFKSKCKGGGAAAAESVVVSPTIGENPCANAQEDNRAQTAKTMLDPAAPETHTTVSTRNAAEKQIQGTVSMANEQLT